MAKEQNGNMAGWMKFAIGILVILGIGVGWGVAYTQTGERIKTNTTATQTNAAAIVDTVDKMDAHKDDNLKTEKEQAKKHEQMIERQHKVESLYQQQITILQGIAEDNAEAKQDRKEIKASQAENKEALIELKHEVSKWEITDAP